MATQRLILDIQLNAPTAEDAAAFARELGNQLSEWPDVEQVRLADVADKRHEYVSLWPCQCDGCGRTIGEGERAWWRRPRRPKADYLCDTCAVGGGRVEAQTARSSS